MAHLFEYLSSRGLIFALFVLGLLAIPYSIELRQILSALPLPVVRRWIENSDAARFLLLKQIHNNSYKFITLVLGQFIKFLFRWVSVGIAILVVFDLANFIYPEIFANNMRIDTLTAGLALGCAALGIVQWLLWARKLLFDLREFDAAAQVVLEEMRRAPATSKVAGS